jgi:hypothetical protein
MQLLVFAQQFFLGLNVVGVLDDASWFRRADEPTLRFVLGAHAFGALVRVDHVDRTSRRDRLIWTNRLACIAGDQVSLIKRLRAAHAQVDQDRESAKARSIADITKAAA